VFGFWSKLSQQYKNAVEKSTTGACSVKHWTITSCFISHGKKQTINNPYIIIIIIVFV